MILKTTLYCYQGIENKCHCWRFVSIRHDAPCCLSEYFRTGRTDGHKYLRANRQTKGRKDRGVTEKHPGAIKRFGTVTAKSRRCTFQVFSWFRTFTYSVVVTRTRVHRNTFTSQQYDRIFLAKSRK